MEKEQWKNIEEEVNIAEKAKRKSSGASRTLKKETGFTKKERAGLKKEELTEISEFPEITEIALDREVVFDKEAKETLEDGKILKDALISLRFKNLYAALRKNRNFEKEIENINQKKIKIEERIEKRTQESLKKRGEKYEMSGEEREAILRLNQKFERFKKEKENLYLESPEAYYGLHLKELLGYRAARLKKSPIIETPSRKIIEEEIIEAIKIKKYPFLHGHMGSGKTEHAKLIAKNISGKEPLVFSGSKETTKSELTGHLGLHKGEMPPIEQILEMVDKEIKNFDAKNTEITKEEREIKHQIIKDYFLEREKRGMETSFDFGYVYKAMKEGVPLIIDELNMIPHSVLGRLNELLKKAPGDIVEVQEDGVEPFKVAEGFFFMFTGNLDQGTEQYIERMEFDPALLRRVHPIKYDYLPQYTEKKADDSISLEDNAGKENEQFHLMLATVMDSHGNIEVPKNTVKKLWRLAMSARVSQDLFAGRAVFDKYYPKAGADRFPEYRLQKINLDQGRIDAIFNAWNLNREKGLDFYVWRYGIGEAINELDKAVLFQMFKINFGFFNGWESNEEEVLLDPSKELVVKPKEEQIYETEFFGPREVVDFAFGAPLERAMWPEVSDADADKDKPLLSEGALEFNDYKEKLINTLWPQFTSVIKEYWEEECIIEEEPQWQ